MQIQVCKASCDLPTKDAINRLNDLKIGRTGVCLPALPCLRTSPAQNILGGVLLVAVRLLCKEGEITLCSRQWPETQRTVF